MFKLVNVLQPLVARIPTALFGFAGLLVLSAPAVGSPNHELRVGALKFEHMQVAETRPGQPAAAAFVKIENKGRQADRLVGATVDASVAERAEIHTMSMEGDKMTMRQLPGLAVPAEGKARLAPGSDHLMLIGLPKPLQAGQLVNVTLTFEKAGAIPLQFLVVPRNAIKRDDSDTHRHH